MSVELAKLLLQSFSALIGLGSILWAIKALKENHSWNRKKAAYDALSNFVSGEAFKTINKLKDYGLSALNSDQNYSEQFRNISRNDRKAVTDLIDHLLDIFESLSIGAHNKVFEEKVLIDYFCVMYPGYLDFF